MSKLTQERLQQIRNILGSCSLEADHMPSLYDELDGHIRAIQQELDIIHELYTTAIDYLGG